VLKGTPPYGWQIKELIGITAAVEVMTPGTIARSLGKLQRIKDLRRAGS